MRVEVIPAEVGKLEKLEVLSISSSGIRELPASIKRLKTLKELDISMSRLTYDQIADIVAELPNLELLYIYGIELECEEVENLRELTPANCIVVFDLNDSKVARANWGGAKLHIESKFSGSVGVLFASTKRRDQFINSLPKDIIDQYEIKVVEYSKNQ